MGLEKKNPDKPIPKLSNEGYANFGLEYGGGLSYSDVDLIKEGQAIGNASPEQKQAFIDIMDMYDAKAPSFAGAGRAFRNILNPFESPTTYAGLGVGKLASTAAKQVAKDQIRNNIVKSLVASKPAKYALIGSTEGAAFGGAYNVARQRARIRADAQEEYRPGEIAEAAGIGTVFGGALGGVTGVIGNALARRKKKTDPKLALPAPQKETDLLTQIIPQSRSLVVVDQPKALPQKTMYGEVLQPKISQEIRDIVGPVQPVNIVVDQDFGIVGKIPYLGNIYKKLGNQVLNRLQAKQEGLSALGDLPDQPQYLGTRGMVMGKLERVGSLTRNVFNTFNKLTPKENKPVYEYLTETALQDVPENLQNNAVDLRRGIDTVSSIGRKWIAFHRGYGRKLWNILTKIVFKIK